MATTAKIEYKGHTFEYDPSFTTSYSFMKLLTKTESNPASFFGALDALFLNKADDYAEVLNDDLVEVAGLLNAIVEANTEAKN